MVDSVDPDRLEKAEFSAVRRGVDPDEVRSVLAEAADGLRLLQRRCHELEHRIEALEAEIPEEGVAEAEREAARAEGRQAGEAEGEQRLAAATSEAEALVEDAKAEGRRLVQEAHTVRRRMLEDLARRRRSLRQQVEQLRGGRERLLEAYEVVGHTMREATEELTAALPEARAAAERAGHRVGPEETVDQLEAEIESARLAGLPIVDDEPAAEPTPEPEPSVDRPSTEGLRRPVAVPLERDVRDMPEVEPVVADFEAVRLLEGGDESGPSPTAEPDEPAVPDHGSEPGEQSEEPTVTDADEPEPSNEPDEATAVEPDGPDSEGPAEEPVVEADRPDEPDPPEHAAGGDLFERLREAQGDDGEAPAGDDPEPERDPPAEIPAADGPDPAGAGEGTGNGFDDPADADEPFGLALGAEAEGAGDEDEQRASAEHELGRRLKRILSDEQNDVLDRLRRTRKRSLEVDDLLDGLDDRVARFAEAVEPVLADAAATHVGPDAPPVHDLAAELAREVAEALLDGLVQPLEEGVAVDELAGPVRSLYREWKTDRIGAIAERYVDAACTPAPADLT